MGARGCVLRMTREFSPTPEYEIMNVEPLEVARVEDSKLAVPVAKSQVEAAGLLHGLSRSWQTVDGVFDSLRDSYPGFDSQSTLIKVTAINALYSTNIYAVARSLCA